MFLCESNGVLICPRKEPNRFCKVCCVLDHLFCTSQRVLSRDIAFDVASSDVAFASILHVPFFSKEECMELNSSPGNKKKYSNSVSNSVKTITTTNSLPPSKNQ